MSSIFHEADCIANSKERLLFGISLGRDSACLLHVLSSRLDLKDHKFVHYSVYDTMLPYQAKQLGVIEARYGIQIDVRPHPRFSGNVTSLAKDRNCLLDTLNCGLMVLGYRMDESLQRRGMLKQFEDGINRKTRECYPLRSWTSRITDAYVKTNKIILAPEYSYNMRDCSEHRGYRAVWLRHCIGEEDYQAAIAQDPLVEIDYVRHEKEDRDEESLVAKIRNGDSA